MPRFRPDLPELIATIREALQALSPRVSPAGQFELRVLVRALDIAARELAQGETARALEHAALAEILGHDGTLDALSTELCARLREGSQRPDDPRLLARLRAAALARLAIDNPHFT